MPYGSMDIALYILSFTPVPNENIWPCSNPVYHPTFISIGDLSNATKNAFWPIIRAVRLINEKACHTLLVPVGADHFHIVGKFV